MYSPEWRGRGNMEQRFLSKETISPGRLGLKPLTIRSEVNSSALTTTPPCPQMALGRLGKDGKS